MILDLPWPPSINHYWRRNPNGPGMFISTEGKRYAAAVTEIMAKRGVQPIIGEVAVTIQLFPPNRLRRDLDNCFKPLLDAVTRGGALGDDFQIKRIHADMLEVIPDGHAIVQIEPLEALLFR